MALAAAQPATSPELGYRPRASATRPFLGRRLLERRRGRHPVRFPRGRSTFEKSGGLLDDRGSTGCPCRGLTPRATVSLSPTEHAPSAEQSQWFAKEVYAHNGQLK